MAHMLLTRAAASAIADALPCRRYYHDARYYYALSPLIDAVITAFAGHDADARCRVMLPPR